MKQLETSRLLLRDWKLEDIGCQVFDEKAIRYLFSAKNNYAVVLKENGVVIGTIGLNEDADENPEVRNVGVRLLEQYQNKDGSITIPEVLRPYLNNMEIIK